MKAPGDKGDGFIVMGFRVRVLAPQSIDEADVLLAIDRSRKLCEALRLTTALLIPGHAVEVTEEMERN